MAEKLALPLACPSALLDGNHTSQKGFLRHGLGPEWTLNGADEPRLLVVNLAVSAVLLSAHLTSVKVAFYSSPRLAVIVHPSVPDMGLRAPCFRPPEPTEVLVLNGCTQTQKAALILLITSCCTARFSAGAASNTLARLHVATNVCKVWV